MRHSVDLTLSRKKTYDQSPASSQWKITAITSIKFNKWTSTETLLSQHYTGALPHLDLTTEGRTQDHDQEHPTDARWTAADITQNTMKILSTYSFHTAHTHNEEML